MDHLLWVSASTHLVGTNASIQTSFICISSSSIVKAPVKFLCFNECNQFIICESGAPAMWHLIPLIGERVTQLGFSQHTGQIQIELGSLPLQSVFHFPLEFRVYALHIRSNMSTLWYKWIEYQTVMNSTAAAQTFTCTEGERERNPLRIWFWMLK